MEQLYKEGKFIFEKGIPKLIFSRASIKAEVMFKRSIQDVVGVISSYDFEKLENKDYYYLYNKKLGKINPKDIKESLNKIFSGDLNEVLDKEHLTLGVLNDEVENTIFWDVLNDVIIVKGKDNIKLLCIELEWMGYSKYGLEFHNEETRINFIMNQHNPSTIIKKIKNFNK